MIKVMFVASVLSMLSMTSCSTSEAQSKREAVQEGEPSSKLVTDGEEIILIPAQADLPPNFDSLEPSERERILIELANELTLEDDGFSLVAGCSAYRCFAAGPRGAAGIGPNGAGGISYITGNYCYKAWGTAAICGNAYY